MNIEEADPVAALRAAGEKLVLFHAADSNRRAVGRGHVPFPSLFRALVHLGYSGPIIVECTPPGPDPFMPAKGEAGQKAAWEEISFSLRTLRFLDEALSEEGVGDL
ncbi:MAG: TIM barrel protein [Candidatus Bipolaricaulota bacterium]